MVVIVSEETGRIGIAVDGAFEMKMNQEQLKQRLRELLSASSKAMDPESDQPPMVDTNSAGLESTTTTESTT